MTKLTFANFKDLLYPGAVIIFNGFTGKVQQDNNWAGGFNCNGRSITNILKEHDVFVTSRCLKKEA